MRKRTLAFTGVVVFALAATAHAQDATTFRYMPSKEPLIYKKTQKLNQTQNVKDMKIKTEMQQTEVDVWSIAKTDKDDLQIKGETKLLKVMVEIGPLGKYKFDSRKDDNEKDSMLGAALTPMYERLRNANLTYTITPQGKLTKLEGLKELLGDVLKDNPIANQFAGGGSEEAARIGVAEYIPALPEKAIRPGDRWETPFQLNLDKFGKANGKRLYAYDGEGTVGKQKTAKISVVTELSFDLDIDQGGAKVTGTLSITASKGTIHFDPKHGRVVSLNNEYTISGNLNVAAGGMNIPVAMEQTQRLTMDLLDSLPK